MLLQPCAQRSRVQPAPLLGHLCHIVTRRPGPGGLPRAAPSSAGSGLQKKRGYTVRSSGCQNPLSTGTSRCQRGRKGPSRATSQDPGEVSSCWAAWLPALPLWVFWGPSRVSLLISVTVRWGWGRRAGRAAQAGGPRRLGGRTRAARACRSRQLLPATSIPSRIGELVRHCAS